MLVEVVLARDGPQHPCRTFVRDVDNGLKLARHFEIDCHLENHHSFSDADGPQIAVPTFDRMFLGIAVTAE